MRTGKWIAWLIIFGIFCLLVCGCVQEEKEPEEPVATLDPTVLAVQAALLAEQERQDAAQQELKNALLAMQELLAQQAEQINELEQTILSLQEQVEQEPPSEDTPVNATDPESVFRYTVSDAGYATITSYLGNEDQVFIPQTLGGCQVVAIGDGAFQNGSLRYVVIPSGVRRVDWFAFSGCHRLERVNIPATVVEIGYGAFERCASSLTFLCPQGCYAAGYAQSYGIPVMQP